MSESVARAIEAEVRLDSGTDPAAVGAAVTVELCGHWEHEGPCRWPPANVPEYRPGGGFLDVRRACGAPSGYDSRG